MFDKTISIFGNKILLEIMNEIKLFSKYKIKFYDNLNLFTKNNINYDQLVILFLTKTSKNDYEKIIKSNLPLIIVTRSPINQKMLPNEFIEQLNIPFSILDLNKKIVSLLARSKFKSRSLINLRGYIINKNERKIKKNNLELQLTEKEINFLILFSQNTKPLSRNFILKNVWYYSPKSDTHTVETHIHRLRKKIFQKFQDNDFIKNDDKGYYI